MEQPEKSNESLTPSPLLSISHHTNPIRTESGGDDNFDRDSRNELCCLIDNTFHVLPPRRHYYGSGCNQRCYHMYATHRVLCQTYEYDTGMDATTIRAEQTKLGRSECSTTETKESTTGQITTTRPLNYHCFERGNGFPTSRGISLHHNRSLYNLVLQVAQKSSQWSGTTIVVGMLPRCTAILDAFVTGRGVSVETRGVMEICQFH